jgi:hypothetical protein
MRSSGAALHGFDPNSRNRAPSAHTQSLSYPRGARRCGAALTAVAPRSKPLFRSSAMRSSKTSARWWHAGDMRQPGPTARPDSQARQPGPTARPDSQARQPGPTARDQPRPELAATRGTSCSASSRNPSTSKRRATRSGATVPAFCGVQGCIGARPNGARGDHFFDTPGRAPGKRSWFQIPGWNCRRNRRHGLCSAAATSESTPPSRGLPVRLHPSDSLSGSRFQSLFPKACSGLWGRVK